MALETCQHCGEPLACHDLTALRRCAREAQWQREQVIRDLIEQSDRQILEAELRAEHP
jgi:hypothetical protein